MKLKDMSKEELEMMSYADLAAMVLNESKKKMKIADVFKKICTVLGLSDAEYENEITQFFEIVSTNKLFTMLPGGFCDLKTRHNTKVVIDDEEEEESSSDEVEESEESEEEIEEKEEDIFFDETDDDDVCDGDELQDFVILDDEETNS